MHVEQSLFLVFSESVVINVRCHYYYDIWQALNAEKALDK